MKTLCVYCGSNPGRDPVYRQQAAALGRELAARRIGLVYGGAAVGVMGAIADAVLTAGGKVTGMYKVKGAAVPEGFEGWVASLGSGTAI